jgi:hypothetical protein
MLELADLARERRLTGVQEAGSRRDATRIGNRDERPDMFQFHGRSMSKSHRS